MTVTILKNCNGGLLYLTMIVTRKQVRGSYTTLVNSKLTERQQMIEDHIKDIDFRKREVRQQDAIKDFKLWYVQLCKQPYSDMIQGQLSMLSAVLWYLLPPKEYKKLVTSKKALNAITAPTRML